jgi:hypothetical protein
MYVKIKTAYHDISAAELLTKLTADEKVLVLKAGNAFEKLQDAHVRANYKLFLHDRGGPYTIK